jgi:hypothetical protein
MDYEFLKHLYRYCEGLIEIRSIGETNGQGFFKLSQKSEMENFCQQYAQNNIYFGVATRDGNGGEKKNIIEFPGVWCDVDFKDISMEKLYPILAAFPLNPSAVASSGGGLHIYWILNEPANLDDADRIEGINRRIATALCGDFKSCDAARILRIPDTKNFKYNPPKDVKILKLNPFEYSLEDFEILPDVKPSKQIKGSNGTNPKGWLLEALKGVKAHDPGRNHTATKIAGYFLDKLNHKDLLTILLAWNSHNRPPLPEKDIFTVYNSVNRYKIDNYEPKRIKVSFRPTSRNSA